MMIQGAIRPPLPRDLCTEHHVHFCFCRRFYFNNIWSFINQLHCLVLSQTPWLWISFLAYVWHICVVITVVFMSGNRCTVSPKRLVLKGSLVGPISKLLLSAPFLVAMRWAVLFHHVTPPWCSAWPQPENIRKSTANRLNSLKLWVKINVCELFLSGVCHRDK